MNWVRMKGHINGATVQHMELEQMCNNISFTGDYYAPNIMHTYMNVSLINSAPVDIKLGAPLVGMGRGFICRHCQTYTPRGKYLCQNCTAPLVDGGLIAPTPFPFVAVETSVYSTPNAYVEQSIHFKAFGNVPPSFFDMFMGDVNLVEKSDYIHIQQGYFICHFCGTVTAEGERCEACDGGRLPFHELVDMNHDCVYCGSETNDGIVCQKCGARMKGVAYHEAAGLDYLSPFYQD